MEFINTNANIFFFVTTILVVIFIILGLILVFAAIKFYKFIARVIDQGDVLLEEAKSNNFIKKAVPIIMPIVLPIISFFAKKKKSYKK